MDSTKSKPAHTKYMSLQDYQDGMRKRAEQAEGSYHTTPSKAWFQDQEEYARRQTPSMAAMNDGGDFKPVPVVHKAPNTVKAPPSTDKPLKSAMKKTSPIKKQEPEPLFNAREYSDANAYYLENDTDQRRREPVRPYRVSKGPSKAYLEEQHERIEELMKQQEVVLHPQARSSPPKDSRRKIIESERRDEIK